jgi:hypothetical protein
MIRHALSVGALFFAVVTVAAMAQTPSGDAVIRAAFRESKIVITTTNRLAGAIHSLKWNEREFIDSTDHGRQLQSAASFDNTAQAGAETFNPTEAGSRRDGAGPQSSSRLLEISVAGSLLRTRTQMAFWLAPGERSEGQPARNTTVLSGHVLEKDVRIGARGMPNVIGYRAAFVVPGSETHRSAQFEALTGYMPADFERFWTFDAAGGKLDPLSDGPGEQAGPIVFSTRDGSHAMGIISPAPPRTGVNGPVYGRWRFVPERVVKWNCVFREQNSGGLAPGPHRFEMFVAIGTLTDVEAALKN